MTIEFSCPKCAKLLRTSDDRAGATALCPECDAQIEVPAAKFASAALSETVAEVSGTPPALHDFVTKTSAGPPVAGSEPKPVQQFKRNFCSACGKPISDWLLTCPACGAPVASPALPAGNMVYAGFWIRVCAFILDYVAFWILIAILAPILRRFPFGLEAGGFGTSVLYAMYKILLESSEHQATLGKMVVGVIVTDNNGRRLTIGRAAGRFFAKFLSWITLCIGFAMAGFMPRKRALHDVIAETLVVYKNR